MATRTQRIIALRNRRYTRPAIAARLGISENLLGVYLHGLLKKGIIKPIAPKECRRRQRTAASKVNVGAARRMRFDGKTYRNIGRHFGVAGSTISRLLGSTVRVTPMQRRLICLHRQGLTYEAIAARLRKPMGTVSVMLSRLVRKGLLPRRSRCGSSESIQKTA